MIALLCWILVEPPSPQEFAPLHNQAMGRVPWPLKINASHDMYLRFGPQFPDGQTSSLCHGSRNYFLGKNRRKLRSKGVVTHLQPFPWHKSPTARTNDNDMYGTYFMMLLCTRRHVLHTRIQKTLSKKTENGTMTWSQNPAQLCEDQTLVFPRWLRQRGKTLSGFAPWRFRFACALHTGSSY